MTSLTYKRLRILFYALPVAFAGVLYLLAFYPAVMTFDSLYQWQQVVSGQYTDWHPVLSTLLIGLARFIWNSPASMVLFQIIILSLTVGWGLAVMEDLGANRIAVWFACILFAISPLNGAFVVTIWKDIPYGISVLALTIIIARIVTTNGRWLEKRLAWLIFGLLLAFCMLVRHNGITVALGTPFMLALMYRRHTRAIAGAVLICVVVVLLVRVPLYQALQVEKRIVDSGVGFDGCQMRDIPIVAQIVAHIDAGTPLKDTEQEYLNKIQPLDPPWYYNKHSDALTIHHNRIKWEVINNDFNKLYSCYAALTLRRPWVNIRHFISHSTIIWCPYKKGNIFNVGVFFGEDNRIIYITPEGKVPDLHEEPKLPWLTQKLAQLVVSSQSGRWNIWQSAVYFYLFLIGVMWAVWRAGNARVLLLALPVILQTALLVVFIPSADSRYQYPVYLIAHVFWPALFFGRFPTRANINDK